MNWLSISKEKIFDIFCITSIYIFSLHIIFIGLHYQVIASIIVFPYLIFRSRHLNFENRGLLIYYVYTLIAFVFSIFNIFFTNNGIGGCLILIANITLGLYCIDNIYKLKIHILVILWINMVYIVYQVLYLGILPNEIYEKLGLSRNHGGLLLCLVCGFYCYTNKISCKKISILIPLIAMYCAYLLVGRSSLGLLIALFIVSLIATKRIELILFVVIAIISILMYYKQEIMFLYEASSFAENGLESSRYKIWDIYFNNLNFQSSIFGLDTVNIPYIRDYGGNPHNSFLNFHRRLGLIPLVLFFIISGIAMYKYVMNKAYYLLCIMLIIYFRIFFDSDCFIGPYDYILYTIAFYPIIKYRSISLNKNNIVNIIKYSKDAFFYNNTKF